MTPAFTDPAARILWQHYFTEVDRAVSRLGTDGATLRDDLAAHLADSYAAGDPALAETARLKRAIDRLGRPADYLRPMLADELIDRGTRSYHPVPIARGLYHSLRAGSRRAAIGLGFGLGYLMLAVFTAMAVLKPFWGESVGLFRYPDGSIAFGIVSDTAGTKELLGLWIIPIALVVAGLLYLILTRALRALRNR